MLSLCSWVCILSCCVTAITAQVRIPEIDFENTPVQIADEFYECCATPVTCDSAAKYRTINGTCNNLENPLWGSSKTPFIRLGSAYYADDDHQIRFQLSGNKLPGARELQLAISAISPNQIDPLDFRNLHVNQVGQWLTHDITLTLPDLSGPNDCCEVQNSNSIPPQCGAVITLDPMDQVYMNYGIPQRTCMSFRRAMTTTLNFNCTITPQIPLNQATVFLDASQLYGHTNVKAASLRTMVDGKLKTEIINGQEFCVQQKRNSTICNGRDNVCVCFDHGDIRNNQHFGIILYGELFLRLHNHIAGLLKQINPDWTDEILYLEARRIVGAFSQIFVYRDYMPLLFGEDYSEKAGLTLSKYKKTVYDESLIPQVAAEFSSGSLRVLHNIIPSEYSFVNENNEVLNTLQLHEFMSFPDLIVEDKNLEYLLRGMSLNSGRCPVASYNFGISNFMFHNMIKAIADSDLLAIDIQRGRDVGIPPYIIVRELCGFPKITSFSDLIGILPPVAVEILQFYYEDVADIDLVVASLLEPIVPGGMVGETTRCILADGFFRIRYGDRFFCDVQNQPGSFTDEQFEVLWNLDLTQIFCAMSKIDKLPCDIFMSYGFSEMRDCEELDLNLEAWRDNSGIVSKLAVEWKANSKAWMTTHIMTDWLKRLDQQMETQNRKM